MGRIAVLVSVLATILVACGSSAKSSAAKPSPKMVSVTIAMGYIPNVQFAPFYVAQARGYYRQAGLDVHLRYGIEPDLLRLASVGKVEFVDSGGDEVLTAGAHGLHVKYVMTQYSRFPSALFALRSSGITSVRKLRGRSIGIPGKYGASYVGLLTLLSKNHIPASAVSIRSIGFTQVESVVHHRVDAAVGFATNEPIQLRHQGLRVTEFDVWHWANIAGAGIATGDQEIARHPAIVRAFVHATVRGLAYTLRHPAQAFRISGAAIKLHSGQAVQRAVLQRSVDFWRSEPRHRLGWMDAQVWRQTGQLLYRFRQIPHPVAARRFYTNRFISSP